MTGFGRAVVERDGYRVSVEARSVNHRYLDLSIRLRDGLRTDDTAIRRAVAARLARGRVEVTVAAERVGESEVAVEVRLPVISSVVAQLATLRDDTGALPPIEELSWGELLRIPEAVVVHRPRLEPSDVLELLEVEAVVAAIEDLVAARAREGDALMSTLLEITVELEDLVEQLAARVEDDRRVLVERSRARLLDLLAGAADTGSSGIDEGRLLQEAAAMAERMDVAEEVARLEGHLAHFEETARAPGAIGRRLDFLTQEILRELQTTGAKLRVLESQRLALEAKVLADRLREQVQNVE